MQRAPRFYKAQLQKFIKNMNASEIRQAFLSFFEGQGHAVLPSSSLVPEGDKTLMFANAGMNQFKDVFTGQTPRKVPCATIAEVCAGGAGFLFRWPTFPLSATLLLRTMSIAQ